jgi:hypothetical protein
MVAPDVREELYYPAYEAELLKEYRQRFDVLFTAAGKSVQAALRRRLGYRVVGRWTTITIAETLAFRAARDLGPLVARRARCSAARACASPIRPCNGSRATISSARNGLWSEARCSSDLAPHRTAKFLRWRLATHAWNRFQCAFVARGERDQASSPWREEAARAERRRFWSRTYSRATTPRTSTATPSPNSRGATAATRRACRSARSSASGR